MKNRIFFKIIIPFVISLLLIFAWGALTKAGYVPNFFDIRILEEDHSFYPEEVGKPVIYLYPKQEQKTFVKLEYQGQIIAEYPDYNPDTKGWEVIAYPDGKLLNLGDGKEYSYLFWEGRYNEEMKWDISTGFVVEGSKIKEFLQEKLFLMGLTPKEYNEFIVYWYPKMQENKYNLIHFAGNEYTDTAVLSINPKPDSILRVFMVYKALEEPIEIQEQELETFQREGFVVVEWGGTQVY